MRKMFVNIVCSLPAIQLFGWSILSGIIGTLILAGFSSGIMPLETLSTLLPFIVGFNGAISGYMLIERAEDEIYSRKSLAATVGVMVAVLSFVSINSLCFKIGGFFLMSGSQGLVATIGGAVSGWAGGVLAIKHRALREQPQAL